MIEEDDKYDIDLTQGGQLNEWYNTVVLGEKIKQTLWLMFGSDSSLNPYSGTIKGTPQQIKSFASTLAAEKSYMSAFNAYGLNSPATFRSKAILNNAVASFERETGIIWPFK